MCYLLLHRLIFLSSLFSNTLSLCSSLNKGDQVSHPHKITGIIMVLFSAVVGLLVTNRPRLRTLPPPHSYRNQRLQRQFDGLLMMGIVMPETC